MNAPDFVPSPRLRAVLTAHDVTLLEPRQAGRGQREPRSTCAGGTLERILDHHGDQHLHDVLTVIIESENNRLALIGPVITAVSATLLGRPRWYADNADSYLQVVDRINLMDLHRRAKRNRRSGVEPWKAIATLLHEELARVFDPHSPDLVDKMEHA